jgi:hypothetical protein
MRALHLNENAMIVQLVLSWKAMYTLPLKFPTIPDNSSNTISLSPALLSPNFDGHSNTHVYICRCAYGLHYSM